MGSENLAMIKTEAMAAAANSKIKPQPSYPPNPTLYLSNIDWSIKKALLKRSLLALFSRHGKVLEVICLRGDANGNTRKPLRGQAWVIFETLTAATSALQAERGFVFFGRPLTVNYAREVSDRIAKRDGNGAKAKERRAAAAKRKIEDGGGGIGEDGNYDDAHHAKLAKLNSASAVTSVSDPTSLLVPPAGMMAAGGQSAADSGDAKKKSGGGGVHASAAPSSLLLAKNLPPECNELMLRMLFKQYSGYKEVKLAGGGGGMIEFGTESEATSALKALNGFKLTTSASLDLTYGER